MRDELKWYKLIGEKTGRA